MGFFDRNLNKEKKINEDLIEKIKEKKYYMVCLKKCFGNFVDYMSENEKLCLAKCNDNIHVYLKDNYEDLMVLKSKI